MVHNGIEYGLMQAYAEGFELMSKADEFDLDLHEIASIWRYGSVVRSWLLELAELALRPGSGFEDIEAFVVDSGEGRWTVEEAIAARRPGAGHRRVAVPALREPREATPTGCGSSPPCGTSSAATRCVRRGPGQGSRR